MNGHTYELHKRSCETRFGKLLQMNSVVLKEQTRYIEYYYRSVKPDKHFVAFTKEKAWQVGWHCGSDCGLGI